jgi:hypothetical protein
MGSVSGVANRNSQKTAVLVPLAHIRRLAAQWLLRFASTKRSTSAEQNK